MTEVPAGELSMGTQAKFCPPFRAEHVGSLLRPPALKTVAKAYQKEEVSEEEYFAVLDQEIAGVVRLQESVGLKSITDGEFGKTSWFGFFFERLEGFCLKESLFDFHDVEGEDHGWMTCYTSARMHRPRPICVEEFERLRKLTAETPKVNMPSPSALHFFRGDQCRDETAYPDIEAWWEDLIGIYQAELQALGRAGCMYLQLDEVPLALLCDVDIQKQVRGMGLDPGELVARYIGTVNRILESRPAGMTVGMHLCRGNFRSRWMGEGGYDPVAERLFNDVDVDVFFLEYDTSRSGDFTPLENLPDDKSVVLGLVSTKSPVLEDGDALRHRIDEASRYVPLERLALSPQCGFASVAGGNPLSEDEQRAKLELIVGVARDVWGEP